jgi:galactofuranose transport system permease protein
MRQQLNAFIQKNSRFIPMTTTAVLAFVAYGIGAIFYPGMRDPQVFLNIFRNNSYLLISAVGMTLVIISGGIDLSVGGVIALVTVSAAALIRAGWDPWLVIVLMLVLGMALGSIMGSLITYLKVQPFIVTLAGLWFARGMCFFISDDAIAINHPVYTLLAGTKFLIPGLTELFEARGVQPPYVSFTTIAAFLLLGVGIYLAHFTRWGRTIYAMGGNEQSARLMGLPVNSSRILVYTFSGFCSGLAGVALSIFVLSGHGLYVWGFEMDVIAAVVIGGTMLTGGVGYLAGTPFGVMVLGDTQTLIQFNGSLSSWWSKIVIGLLMLVFIGIQAFIAARTGGRRGKVLSHAEKRRRWALAGAGALVLLGVIASTIYRGGGLGNPNQPAETKQCTLQPFRQDKAANLIKDGAVIAYERNGGPACVDELFGIYPDGRIIGDNGKDKIDEKVTTATVNEIKSGIINNGFFTDELYDTWHTPCGQCYGYYLTVVDNGQQKTVKGVDGGTDAPAVYWQIISLVKGLVPKFASP